jgi:hypothetical protein
MIWATSVDSIRVEGDIQYVESNSTHVFFADDTFLGGPLEGSDEAVLDFVQILHSLGHVNKQVGTGGLGSETPDLSGISNIPTILVGQNTSSLLGVISGRHITGFDLLRKAFRHGFSSNPQTIVLVGRFG